MIVRATYLSADGDDDRPRIMRSEMAEQFLAKSGADRTLDMPNPNVRCA